MIEADDKRAKLILESVPSALVVVDGNGTIVHVNSQTDRLFRYERDELVGKPVEILVPDRYREAHPNLRKAFFSDPKARPMGAGRELHGRRKDGTEFPVEIGLNPIDTPEGRFVLAAIADITDRKLAEERFRLAVEAAPSAMVMVDGEGRIVLINEQAERVFGYDRSELLGMPVEMLVPEKLRPNHPVYRNGFIANPATRPMGGGRDLYGRRKDGREIPVEIGLNPIRTSEGLFVLAAIVDITERKRAGAMLSQQADALARSNRDLETILHIAAHDLKAPLTAIASFAKVLCEKYENILDEKGMDYLQRIDKGAERMRKLLEDLLVLSRLSRIESPPESVNADDFVNAALLQLAEPIRATGAEVTLERPLPRLRVHRAWAEAAIKNLVGNALKFTRPGVKQEISIAAYSGPEGQGIVVRDRGQGLPVEMGDRIFDLFTRGVGREIEGTGAGLAIVRQIAERHGGKAWALPRVDGGSEFYITFEPPTTGTISLHVLIADDDDDFVMLTRDVLMETGAVASTDIARDGVETLSILRKEGNFRNSPTPDLILLDLRMPRKDGFQVLTEIRIDPLLSEIPIVIVTSSSRVEDRTRALAEGALECITKPLSGEKFMDIAKRVAG